MGLVYQAHKVFFYLCVAAHQPNAYTRKSRGVIFLNLWCEMIDDISDYSGAGFHDFIGRRILILCANYFYTGKLVRINDDCVLLEDAYIVFETGALDSAWYKDAQKLESPVYVRMSAIESFMAGKVNV